jgi:hypothetical protein
MEEQQAADHRAEASNAQLSTNVTAPNQSTPTHHLYPSFFL